MNTKSKWLSCISTHGSFLVYPWRKLSIHLDGDGVQDTSQEWRWDATAFYLNIFAKKMDTSLKHALILNILKFKPNSVPIQHYNETAHIVVQMLKGVNTPF